MKKRAFFATLVWCFLGRAGLSADTSSTGPLGPVFGPIGYQRAAIQPPLPAGFIADLDRPSTPGAHAKGRLQIGVGRPFESPIILNSNTVKSAEWNLLSNAWRIWSSEIISEGAVGLRVHIESLSLPAGVRLLVYDPANPAAATKPIVTDSLAGQRETWTPTILADHVVLECEAPPGADLSAVSFAITGVCHLYRSPLAKQAGDISCIPDVACYPAWATQATGIARISYVDDGDGYLCTGSVLATSTGQAPVTSTSGVNYFLTANHCVNNQTIASTIEFDWFYQAASCGGPSPDTWPTTGGGATFLAGASGEVGSDFAFMRLRETPPQGVYALAWSTNTPTYTEPLTCIQHPEGDDTRISFGNLVAGDPLDLGPEFWSVVWTNGVTADGSSGSPLLNDAHQIIGQLYGGESSCDDPTGPDVFGKFAVTYAAIKSWLLSHGTYYGLFSVTSGVAQASSGSFTLTTQVNGKFSGSLQMGAERYSMSGSLDQSGNANATVLRGKLGALSVTFQVDLTGGSDQVTGTITSTNENWTASLLGNLAIFDAKYDVAPQNGRYTLIIQGHPGSLTEPGGDGYGTVVIDTAGKITFTGTLADGTVVAQTSSLSQNGQWPLYIPLYGGQGSLLSWVTVTSPTGVVSGTLSWIKPAMKANYYSAGFTNPTAVVSGSFYDPTQPLLGFAQGNAVLSGGDLASSATNAFNLEANDRVQNLSATNKFSLVFSTSTGVFTGSIADPASSKPVRYGGVVLQNLGTGAGFWHGTKLTGLVVLQAQ